MHGHLNGFRGLLRVVAVVLPERAAKDAWQMAMALATPMILLPKNGETISNHFGDALPPCFEELSIRHLVPAFRKSMPVAHL